MKKINWAVVVALLATILIIAFYLRHMDEPPVDKETPPRTNVKSVKPLPKEREEILVDGRTVIGKVSEEQRKNPTLIHPTNTPSAVWEKNLLQNLNQNGGEGLQNIAIKKVQSVVWMKNEGSVNAESVIITLKNKEGAESTFRALVDSQTGMILETWDRTIFEPVGHRDHHEHTIQVDERYFTE